MYKVLEDCKLLLPNKEHENFTESNFTIDKDTILLGNNKRIIGKRRGDDFIYRIFVTDDKKILYTKNIKDMREINLYADGSDDINRNPKEDNTKLYGALIGLVAGYALHKYGSIKVINNYPILSILSSSLIGYFALPLITKK
jgi:hypothetical protein